jgi:hypothetical protein
MYILYITHICSPVGKILGIFIFTPGPEFDSLKGDVVLWLKLNVTIYVVSATVLSALNCLNYYYYEYDLY